MKPPAPVTTTRSFLDIGLGPFLRRSTKIFCRLSGIILHPDRGRCCDHVRVATCDTPQVGCDHVMATAVPMPLQAIWSRHPVYLCLLAPYGTSTAGIPFESDKHYEEKVGLGTASICSMPEGRRRTVRCRLPWHSSLARQLPAQREAL